jgi:hypothetical protein
MRLLHDVECDVVGERFGHGCGQRPAFGSVAVLEQSH